MTFPAVHRPIERLSADGMGSVEGAAPFFSACGLGLIAPFLLFANDLSQPTRIGALIACFFTGRLVGQCGGRQATSRFTPGRLEIAARLIAAASYLCLAAVSFSGSARSTQLLIFAFITGMCSAMTIAPYASAQAALSAEHQAIGRVTGLGFGIGWLLAAAVFALYSGIPRPEPLSALHWVAPVAAAMEVTCLFLILPRATKKFPIARSLQPRDPLDVASHTAVLGCAMACTSVALVAGECAELTPAMMSALIGGLAVIVIVMMRWTAAQRDPLRGIIGLALTLVGIIGSLRVYYTSSRLLCIAAATLFAIGWGVFQANRSAKQSTRMNTIVWIVGPLISSSLYYAHLRTSVLLPALVIVAAAIGIISRTRSRS